MISKMVSISKYAILFIFAILFIKSCGLSEERATVSIEVGVKKSDISRAFTNNQINTISRGVIGTHSDIKGIIVDVNYSDTGLQVVNSQETNTSPYGFTIFNLPLKKIILTAKAKNDRGTTIFTGRTEKIIDKTDSKIYINLYSIDDGNITSIPQIRSILQVSGNIDIIVGDNNATELSWNITPKNGASAITTTTLNGNLAIANKKATINLAYNINANHGKYEYLIKLENNRGGVLETTFTVFIEETVTKNLGLNIAPVINNIIVDRISESEISFEANATDDKNISNLTYSWSVTGSLGRLFGFYSKTLTIKNFDSTIDGELKVEVRDGGNLTHSLDFNISANAFDSNIDLKVASVDTSRFRGGGGIRATFNKVMYEYLDDNSTISVIDMNTSTDINGSSRRDSINERVIIFNARDATDIDSSHNFRLIIKNSIKDIYNETLDSNYIRNF